MIQAGLYNPLLTKLKFFRRPYHEMIEAVNDEIKESVKKSSTFFLEINHADGDAMSVVLFALLLDELKEKYSNLKYNIAPYNGTHHLTFSASIFPYRSIRDELSKGNEVTYITVDNTPWPFFWKQVKSFYSKLDDEEKKKIKIIDIDHHPFVERDKISWVRFFEEDENKETPKTIYINAGLNKETLDTWYKEPNIPCAGEVSFDITKRLIDELYPEKSKDFVEKAVIPLLVATETDMRTNEAIERYAEFDRKVYREIVNACKWKISDKYRGEIIIPTKFVNIANGAIRISGAMIDKPYYEIMDERIISNYPTHRALYDIARSLYFASKFKNPKALIADPREIGLGNHSPLYNVLRLDTEHSKIKSGLRKAFLEWDFNSYRLKDDSTFKSEETNILISMIYGKNRIINLRNRTIDISKLLKVAPYMQFFLTQYFPIANSPLVSSSSFVVTAVEGQPYEPESYTHISLRTVRGKTYSYPLGLIGEGAATFLKNEYDLHSEDVQGGGHPRAAALRIKQKVLNQIMKEKSFDKFETIDWIIKKSLSYVFPE